MKVADDPAATVIEKGETLRDDGFPLETFRTVLPPSRSNPVSGGPKGATMMKYFVPATVVNDTKDCLY